jgi:hypothetical protein
LFFNGTVWGTALPSGRSPVHTPRLFSERYDLAPRPNATKSQLADRNLEADCRDLLVEVGDGGTFLKVHAKSEDPAIVHWGFEYLLKKLSNRWGSPPHLIVARGAQWSRDSKRDFKVVGGKLDSDPDEE